MVRKSQAALSQTLHDMAYVCKDRLMSAKIFIIYNILYTLVLQHLSTVSTTSIYFDISRALKHMLFLTTITSQWESVHYISGVFLTTATKDCSDYIGPTESNNRDYVKVFIFLIISILRFIIFILLYTPIANLGN